MKLSRITTTTKEDEEGRKKNLKKRREEKRGEKEVQALELSERRIVLTPLLYKAETDIFRNRACSFTEQPETSSETL